jgi:hypothetical protein
VLAGRALQEDIESYIAAWHDAPDGSAAAECEVYEYLGLTWEEYRLWGERPESLRFSFAARRTNMSIEQLLRSVQTVDVAARSANDGEAAKVLRWLEERGRLQPTPPAP